MNEDDLINYVLVNLDKLEFTKWINRWTNEWPSKRIKEKNLKRSKSGEEETFLRLWNSPRIGRMENNFVRDWADIQAHPRMFPSNSTPNATPLSPSSFCFVTLSQQQQQHNNTDALSVFKFFNRNSILQQNRTNLRTNIKLYLHRQIIYILIILFLLQFITNLSWSSILSWSHQWSRASMYQSIWQQRMLCAPEMLCCIGSNSITSFNMLLLFIILTQY